MRLIQHEKAKDYLKENLDYLEQEEVINSLIIGIALSNLELLEDSTLYLSILIEEEIVFSAIKTEGRNLLISGKESTINKAAVFLIDFLEKEKIKLPGIIGPKDLTIKLAGVIEKKLGWTSQIIFRQLIYKLEKVDLNPKTSGRMRIANLDDLELITNWFHAFLKEALNEDDVESARKGAKHKIENNEVYLWQDEVPVAMSCIARPSKNGISINYVYSPKENRGKGYGTKVVAMLSEKMLNEEYEFCTLFTDMDFPTSNSIYKRIGYLPVGEFRVVSFDI